MSDTDSGKRAAHAAKQREARATKQATREQAHARTAEQIVEQHPDAVTRASNEGEKTR